MGTCSRVDLIASGNFNLNLGLPFLNLIASLNLGLNLITSFNLNLKLIPSLNLNLSLPFLKLGLTPLCITFS
jgi:hypothetical protein